MERKEIAKRLGRELASKGVPVLCLATNIFEDNYSEVRMVKQGGRITVETACFIEDEDGRTDLRYAYHYDERKVLQRIEETVAGRTSPIYDRQTELGELAAGLGIHQSPESLNIEQHLLKMVEKPR